jgi:putative hemolysin
VFGGAASELLLILGLILLNGFFAAAEIAILTARRGRLQQLADAGDGAARVALDLGRDADRFLPTVQVGITLVGTLAAVFGGARVAETLAAVIAKSRWIWFAEHAESIALTTVVLGIAFCSLILGELVPKRVALQNAEIFARVVAYPMRLLQQFTRPAIWVLQGTTWLALRLLGMKSNGGPGVSVEDIEHLIEAGGESGILEEHEHRMAMEALRLGDRTVTEILRPRIDIDALDLDTPSDEVVGAMAMSGFSRVPVCEGNVDHIVGFVYIKDVFLQQYLNRPIDLRRIMRPALFVPKTLTISRLLEQFRLQRTQLAIVLDEYGGTQGMVTLEDVLEVLVGDIHDEHRQDKAQHLVRREDGSWLVDASVNLHELDETLELTRRDPAPRGVGTAAGLVLALLKRPPHIGDVVEWSGCLLEVVDMDGPRIDRLLVTPRQEGPRDADTGGAADGA